MVYTKPTIVALSAASVAIQGTGTKGSPHMDADPTPANPQTTAGSYDLDE
jgi:hypothetical protein